MLSPNMYLNTLCQRSSSFPFAITFILTHHVGILEKILRALLDLGSRLRVRSRSWDNRCISSLSGSLERGNP